MGNSGQFLDGRFRVFTDNSYNFYFTMLILLTVHV